MSKRATTHATTRAGERPTEPATTRAAADAALHEAREILERAVRAHDEADVCTEDTPVDAEQLELALGRFEHAAAGYRALGLPSDEARARIGCADAHMHVMGSVDARRAVESCAREALALLDSVTERADALAAYLRLAEARKDLVSVTRGNEGEDLIDRTIGVLHAAEYLADTAGDGAARARIHDCASRVLGERFRDDRDVNLLDAVAAGEQALAELRARHTPRSVTLPSLLNHLGNCCMKVETNAAAWRSRGLEYYAEGLAVVEARWFPRLKQLLVTSVTMASALVRDGNGSLPQQEMVARFASRAQRELDRHDLDGAASVGWEFLRWAWSLPDAPNVHVGEAHKLLARIAASREVWDDAVLHFYHATAVLAARVAPGHPWFALVEAARAELRDALARAGRQEVADALVAQAAQALPFADATCAQVAPSVAADPAAALPPLEQAARAMPHHPTVRFYLGVARALVGNAAGALEDFDASLALRPDNVRVLFNRGSVKEALGDLPGARADFERARDVTTDPEVKAAAERRLGAAGG